jgi:hypothetical protein
MLDSGAMDAELFTLHNHSESQLAHHYHNSGNRKFAFSTTHHLTEEEQEDEVNREYPRIIEDRREA